MRLLFFFALIFLPAAVRAEPLTRAGALAIAETYVGHRWMAAGKNVRHGKDGAAVSAEAVGIDCSGFVSRCWGLAEKHSTSMLFGIAERLRSADELRPADALNTAEGHVLLFVRWLDDEKRRALFYEAAPFSKTRATERTLAELIAAGYVPLRYRKIRE